MKRPWARWLVVAVFAGAIFSASSISDADVSPPAVPHLDKVMHFGVYFLFAAAVCWAMTASKVTLSRAVWIAAAAAALYGLSDEFHQSFVAGRTATVGDWLADFLGGLSFALVRLSGASGSTPPDPPKGS